MLLLLFEIGNGRYALEISQVIEIVPLVKLKKIPTTPAYVSGLMNYRGKGIPVVDLHQLIENTSMEDVFSTRIVIISYPLQDEEIRPLGLIAGNVTETVRTKLNKPPPTGVFLDSSLYDGDEAPETTDMIQWFDIRKMLPAEEIATLFKEEE